MEQNNQTIVIDDFNIDILGNNTSKQFVCLSMETDGYTLQSTKRTYVIGYMLDHFWDNLHSINIMFTIFDSYWIDHYANIPNT